MPENVTVLVNGQCVTVPAGTVVAAAIERAGIVQFRRSILGELRSVLCGMGICMECRVTIDGHLHCQSCQTVCRDGMNVSTDE